MIPSLSEIHAPVLENEILEYLDPANEGLYVDGTLGLGGHSSAILEKANQMEWLSVLNGTRRRHAWPRVDWHVTKKDSL